MGSQAYEELSVLGGELVTYIPYGKSGKTVLAVIDPIRRTDQMGNQTFLTKTYEVWIVRSATEGVASVKAQFDLIKLRIEPGDDVETSLRVTKIYPDRDRGTPGDGVGLWHLEAVI